MLNNIIATTAVLAGSALAQSVGQAVVVNSCDYPVYLQNTPSAGGGYNAISQTLNTGASYSQAFTELTNGNGWSLKLSREDGAFEDNVMQYEYTWHGWDGEYGGLIWFDLSDVNGNPWDGNWELTANGNCSPRQAAYQYSTDDAYGMQSCPGSSAITVTLCSGNSGSGSGSGSGSPSPVSPLPLPTLPPVVPSFDGNGSPVNFNDKVGHKNKATPTTFATVNRGGVTVTEVATQVVTNFVTAEAGAAAAVATAIKRHEHIARHAHHHNRI